MEPKLDYRRVFSETLREMIDEVFEAHGIEWLEEDVYVDIVQECTNKVYMPGLQEFRRTCRQPSVLDGFRFRW